MPIHPCRTVAAALTLCSLAHAGGLQNGWRAFRDPTIQDNGYEWASVGHARNADWQGNYHLPPFFAMRRGGVDYRYRISKTEVTNRQWYEFVVACAPFLTHGQASDLSFTGLGIGLSGGGGYSLSEYEAEHGAQVGWRYAARYVNWLHNNKVNEAWAFESGVYDTSTFGGGTQGDLELTDQRERSEGARFFLPTQDEWVKAVHFDPDRYGEGQEGYWLNPYSSDSMPISGAPGASGAQTDMGLQTQHTNPIMSYPDAQTPWGLFDASGSVLEWLENLNGNSQSRLWESSDRSQSSLVSGIDRISGWGGGAPDRLIGIRLASVVPGPGTAVLALTALLAGRTRRR